MNIDLELRAMLDEVLCEAHTEENLKRKYVTWQKLKHNGLTSFKDFVIGDLNGQMKFCYTTYNGKTESELEDIEQEFLDETLIQRVYGLEPVIEDFLSNNEVKFP
jgi:hypothetical protein